MDNKNALAKPPPDTAPKSKQYDLFANFTANDDSGLSNTIEYWESIPKYFLNPQQAKKLRTADGLASPHKAPYTLRDKQGRPLNYEIEIQPALIEQPDGSYKAFFPGHTEEMVEEVLKKIFTDQKYGLHLPEDIESWVRFTYGMLRRELKAIGCSRTLDEIKHALLVMTKCHLTVFENGRKIYSEPILPTYISVDRYSYLEDTSAIHLARLPALMSSALHSLDYRQFNYERLADLKGQLARWLYKRMINRFVQASVANTYHFMYSEVKADSKLLNQNRERDNRTKFKEAIKELKSSGVALTYQIEEKKEGRRIANIKATITPTPEFSSEQRAANARRRDSEIEALNAGVQLVDKSGRSGQGSPR